METLTMNDGTVLNGTCIQDDINLYVYLTGMSLAEGFAIFSDADKTFRITARNHDSEHVYEGYTEIRAINSEYGNCNLTMRRGMNA